MTHKDQQIKAQYHIKGFAMCRGLYDLDDVQRMIRERDHMLKHQDTYHPHLEYRKRWFGKKMVERLLYTHNYSKVFTEMLQHKKLNEVVSSLMNHDDRVTLLIDKLIFKPPGQKGYGPHQDMAWWKKEGYQEAISALIAIDDSDDKNGAVQFLPSTHQKLLTDPQDSRDLTMTEIRQFGQAWEQPHLKPGDVLFFHGLTIHKSDANRSKQYRSTYYVSFALPEHAPSH